MGNSTAALQQQLQEQSAQLQASQQQLQQLQAQLQAAHANAPAPGPAAGGLKPAKPSAFLGSKSCRASVDSWVHGLDTYFLSYPNSTDQQRIAYAASLLQKGANKWWRANAQEWTDPAQPRTWMDFKAAFLRAFSLPNKETHARECLRKLYQTGSVADYASAFRELLLEIPTMPRDTEGLFQFVLNLKDKIKDQVRIHNPATLEDAIIMADHIDNNTTRHGGAPGPHNMNRYGAGRKFQFPKGRSGFPNRNYTSRPPGNGNSNTGPTPMELGAIQSSRVRTKLTEEERRDLIAKGGCTYCRRLGHTIEQCRSRPARPTIQGNGRGQRW
jgi:hypothetical protein